jgi:hypothetical protein
MARFAGGTFPIGGRPVIVTVQPFCMDLTEVTADAYTACAKSGQCTTEHVGESTKDGATFKADAKCNYGVPARGNHPMNCVDWEQSKTYCHAQGKRLPTEEEWQWASQAGSERRAYPWGNVEPSSQPCWSGIAKRRGTCPVGSNPAGDAPGGVHDLLGNVWEWTASAFTIWLTAARSPDAANRIARGGGWSTTDPSHLTAAIRNWRPPVERTDSLGFRCIRGLDEATPVPVGADLSPAQLDDLHRLRQAAEHRDHYEPWTPSTIAKWRGALENYVSMVRRDNQTPLSAAAVPFATYLNAMHNRIHPLFADLFVGSLASVPSNHPLSNPHLLTRVEIVLSGDGHIKQMGIVKGSGVMEFDIGVLDAVDKAQPFGAAPSPIVSQDGNVYLHWEFHRDPVSACSTMNARPFLLVQTANR